MWSVPRWHVIDMPPCGANDTGYACWKTQALAAAVAAIDPADEQYEAQKELAEGGALSALASLLQDDSAAVSTAAADALLKLTQHSPAVLNR